MMVWILGGAALVVATGATVWFVLTGRKNGPGEYDLSAEDVAKYQTYGKDRGGLHG
jgi:hypothetical protein